MSLTVATWNVNGIRARAGQLLDWLARDQPDVVCLQEIKASPDQLAELLCELDGYWCYWHGARRLLGRRAARAPRGLRAGAPAFAHPAFDFETRIVHRRRAGRSRVASVYVPNGGKDFAAKMRFLRRPRRLRPASRRRAAGGSSSAAT